MLKKIDNPRAWIAGLINDFLASSPTNDMENPARRTGLGPGPGGFRRRDIFGYPIWQQYKEYVGPLPLDPLGGLQPASARPTRPRPRN